MPHDKPQHNLDVATVQRLSHPLTLETFYRDFYVPRIPVIIKTESFAQLGWQTDRWDNDYLLYKAGSQQVMVLKRNNSSNFSPDDAQYVPMAFHEFIRHVMANPAGNRDIYLNLQKGNIIEAPLLQLLGDFNIPVYFKDLILCSLNVWMGNSSESITTPLHHDFNDNLYAVVEGCKHFTLFPPAQANNLYPQGELLEVEANGYIKYKDLSHKPHMSKLDPANVDLIEFPRYASAAPTRIECTVQKGEMLFLPTGWFHQVTSRGRHIAVSFFSMPPSLEQLGFLKDAIASRQPPREI